MGCYIFDFSMALGHKINNLKLLSFRFKKIVLMRMNFQFQICDIKIKAEIGLYLNIKIKLKFLKKIKNSSS